MNNPNSLLTKNLNVGYKKKIILGDINLSLNKSEIVGVLGRNGSGKSTLLRSVAGIIPEISGEVIINNQNVNSLPIHKRASMFGLGCIMQHDRNIPNLTVEENFHLALNHISKRSDRDKKIQEILSQKPFDQLAFSLQSYANNLSGGQDLLLAIACLLLQDKNIFLLDEPSYGLDEKNRKMLIDIVLSLKEQGKLILIVEQFLRVLFTLADKIYFVNEQNGKQPELADPEVYNTLIELDKDKKERISNIYSENPILSATHADMIDQLLWN